MSTILYILYASTLLPYSCLSITLRIYPFNTQHTRFIWRQETDPSWSILVEDNASSKAAPARLI
ncbi:hypothetical protein P152DRAFT_44086 [Eremomyces bilateralis CBS 781.70]|uniref:Uncharacterized protein n=1 Tax=Eremomyces bilateralis CBS 781.70 TaxID=1392243 RepID=A0A6G1G2C4_9PEZI|nr:uncharacterized protein P152DRAFT_44086 [Eremomyces bilateralis CBS 781.70]KAF1812076.1 hypothetical protein P152DRAFT_44086 [Eremomyces bilateralis CBS 781.70]